MSHYKSNPMRNMKISSYSVNLEQPLVLSEKVDILIRFIDQVREIFYGLFELKFVIL